MQMYAGYQDEIYLNGVLRGIRPKLPVDFKNGQCQRQKERT